MKKRWSMVSLTGIKKSMSFQHGWWLLLPLMGLAGCELTADNVKVPESKPKLVVTSFISPQDTLLKVVVTKSVPIYGQSTTLTGTPYPGGIPNVHDATVVLSDGTTSVNLTTDGLGGLYVVQSDKLPILPGQTYYLTVSTPDGLQVKASCTVPTKANDAITSIRIDSTTTESVPGYSYKEYSVSVEWQDMPGEGDYYRLFAERPYMYGTGYDPANPNKVDTLYSQIFFGQGEEYTKDAGQDGRKFIVRDGNFQANTDNTSENFKVKREINILLLTTDKNYYQYHRGIANYTYDNPFAEPTLLYSNVEGGLGVFAAYQQVKRVFQY
jgi:hypothetical protein